jgi:hypothetical protein
MADHCYAECHIQALYGECRYAECHYAECRGAPYKYQTRLKKLWSSLFCQSVIDADSNSFITMTAEVQLKVSMY